MNQDDVVQRELALREAYRATFSTPQGKQVLAHILKESFVFKTTHVHDDPHTSTLNEGTRRLALSILMKIESDDALLMEYFQQQLRSKHG